MKVKVFAIIPVLILIALTAYASEPMKFTYTTFPPFSWYENGAFKGILVDVIDEAVKRRMQIEVEHKIYPWKRAQLFVEEGGRDAFITVPTDERRRYTLISEQPVVVVNVTLFTYQGNPRMDAIEQIRKIPDLKGFKLLDYLGNGWAEQNLRNMNVEWSNSLDNVLKKLADKRGELFVQASQVTHHNIKRLGLGEKLIEVSNPLVSNPFKLCVGKKSHFAGVIKRFDETILEMSRDGTLEKIYSNYK